MESNVDGQRADGQTFQPTCEILRERSRSPPRSAFASEMRKSMAIMMGEGPENLAEGDALEEPDNDAQNGQNVATECSIPEGAPNQNLSYKLPYGCFGCELRFAGHDRVCAHLKKSASCFGDAWQSAVDTILCLPGAGTRLWCPACPDDFVGKWTGAATKAPSLLRHLVAASSESEAYRASHRRLLNALTELVLAKLPPLDADAEGLQSWAEESRLREAAGPLLAKPGQEARRAICKLQNLLLGPDPHEALPSCTVSAEPSATQAEANSEGAPTAMVDFSKLEIPKGSGGDLYGDLAPTDSKGQAVIVLSDSDGEGVTMV